MDKKYITIIGSREISDEERLNLETIAYKYAKAGYTLRSGGADGSDSVVNPFHDVEIIIPWDGFNGLHHDGQRIFSLNNLPDQEAALQRMLTIHPAPDKLTDGAKSLHTRNIYQVIGPLGKNGVKSELLIYCANEGKDGHPEGGTRTAVVYAKQLEIPVLNIRKTK